MSARLSACVLSAALAWCGAAQAQAVIIYSRFDAAAAQRVRSVATLYEPVMMDRDMPAGATWRSTMAAALCSARVVLLVWSARAAASPEVGAEWRIAAACGRRIVPVLLDDTPLPPEASTVNGIDWR